MPAAIEACQEQDGHAPISQSRARKSGSNLYSRVDRALLNDANGAARLLNRVPSPKVILHELVMELFSQDVFLVDVGNRAGCNGCRVTAGNMANRPESADVSFTHSITFYCHLQIPNGTLASCLFPRRPASCPIAHNLDQTADGTRRANKLTVCWLVKLSFHF